MDISKYHLLLRIAEFGNLTTAAKSMNYTQSTASHAINSMESELGIKLLRRTHSGTQLTREGAILLPIIRDFVECDNRLHALVNSIIALQAGELKIGAFPTIAMAYLPRIISRFHQQHPKIKIEIYSGNGTYYDVEHALLSGLVDCGFVIKPASPGLNCIDLFDDPFCAVLPPTHPLAAVDGPVSFKQLEDTPFLCFPDSNNVDVSHLCREFNFKPQVALTSPDDFSLIAMTESGLGCTILPRLFLNNYPHNAVIREIVGNPMRTVCFAHRANENMTACVRELLSLTQQLILGCGLSLST